MGIIDKIKDLNPFASTKSLVNTYSKNEWTWNGNGFSVARKDLSTLINESFISNPDAYSIISKIAEVGSSINYKVVDEEGEELERTDLEGILKKPNPQQTIKQFMSESIIYLLSSGNTFWLKKESIGFGIAELEVLNSAAMCPILNKNMEVVGYQYTNGNKNETYTVEEIIHIKYLDPSLHGEQSGLGLSPLQAGYLNLSASNDLYTADAHILKNKGASGLISTNGEYPISEEEGKELQKSLDKKISGASKFGKIAVTNSTVGYQQIGMSPTDLKLIESNVQKLRIMCNIFGVDSSLFNDPANKTYNNRLEAEKALYTNAVLPVLDKLVSALNKELIKEDTNNIKPDLSRVPALQDDLGKESDRLQKLVQSGIMTINEAREELGLEPLNDLEDGNETM